MNQPDIRILATPITENSCRFTVDRPVYDSGSFYFGNREIAQQSPLAKRLFDIEGVTSILISHEEITVNKGVHEPWQTVGRAVGAAIREHLQSGEAAVPDELRGAIPSAAEIRSRVESVLHEEINPAVAQHGGFVQLIDVRDNDIFIQMGGGCQGCGMAAVTLKHGVETAIRQAVPEVGGIFDTTDHAAGRNPYYAPQT
jgi:Fe-S cluster biogenesis protein NfuA